MALKKKNTALDTIQIPKVQLYTGKIYVEWRYVYKIGAGLVNLGNTCFMNTVLQCLTYCPPLANYLLYDSDHLSKCKITGFCMMCLLQKHMKRVIAKSGDVIKPVKIYQSLKSIGNNFEFNRQEDAHEFLRYVIDNLCKACLENYNGATKLDPASKETTVINKIFGGYHRSQVMCLQCRSKSNTFDHFMDFILDIKQSVLSLEKALEKFIQPEILQENYKCPNCKMRVSASKKFTVFKAPNVTTFQLKRFHVSRTLGGNITKQVTYPEKLNLRPYMSDPKGPPVWYKLNAVLVHSGPSCNSGHYYCYVKNSNGFWYIMDDERVQQVSINEVLNQSAYVLFYVRIESSSGPTIQHIEPSRENSNSTASTKRNAQEIASVKPLPLTANQSNAANINKIYEYLEKIAFLLSRLNSAKKDDSVLFSSSSKEINSKDKILSTSKNSQVKLVPYSEDSDSSNASEDSIARIKPNVIGKHLTNRTLTTIPGNSKCEIKKKNKPILTANFLEGKTKLSKSVWGNNSAISFSKGLSLSYKSKNLTNNSVLNHSVTSVASTSSNAISEPVLNRAACSNNNNNINIIKVRNANEDDKRFENKVNPPHLIDKELASSTNSSQSIDRTSENVIEIDNSSHKCNFRAQSQRNKISKSSSEESQHRSSFLKRPFDNLINKTIEKCSKFPKYEDRSNKISEKSNVSSENKRKSENTITNSYSNRINKSHPSPNKCLSNKRLSKALGFLFKQKFGYLFNDHLTDKDNKVNGDTSPSNSVINEFEWIKKNRESIEKDHQKSLKSFSRKKKIKFYWDYEQELKAEKEAKKKNKKYEKRRNFNHKRCNAFLWQIMYG